LREKHTIKYRADAHMPVLRYLYNKAHNEALSIQCNTCFDGEDEAIPAQQIANIKIADSRLMQNRI